ncbi:MAG: hypothetical protein GY923_15580, partial [Aestuariibacter sp.]|nr:hypothetical protein [Aestuariibacter sp.]
TSPTARSTDRAQQTFEVTHQFHPLFGQQFELLDHRQTWGEDRIYFSDAQGQPKSLPAAWTSVSRVGQTTIGHKICNLSVSTREVTIRHPHILVDCCRSNRKVNGVVMLWNLMMHALMGWLGAYYFTLSPEGMGMAVLIVCVTQAVDQIRVRKEAWSEVEAMPVAERKGATQRLEANINKRMALVFGKNVILNTVIVLLVAQMARTHGWL